MSPKKKHFSHVEDRVLKCQRQLERNESDCDKSLTCSGTQSKDCPVAAGNRKGAARTETSGRHRRKKTERSWAEKLE